MQVFHRLEEASPHLTAAAVAIGNFDGVHRGHASLLEKMLSRARAEGLRASVLTFYPHPVEVLRPGTHLERLTTTAEKLTLLERMGVELVLVAKFDAALAALAPEEFFERFLLHGLRARSLHVGFDFHFGKARAGDTEMLGRCAAAHGIRLAIEPPFTRDGKKISSSAIRECLRNGDVAAAADLLGRPYFLEGQVVPGDHRGESLGFPTANLKIPSSKVLPRSGVYVTRAIWQQQDFMSVTNIGLRPTFGDATVPRVEAHLIDFSEKVYDETITLELVARLRDELKFDSVEALKAQIAHDVAKARERFRSA